MSDISFGSPDSSAHDVGSDAVQKVYLDAEHATAGPLRVPMREVRLTNGASVVLYDTSGPYTDPAVRPTSGSACRRCGPAGSPPGRPGRPS